MDLLELRTMIAEALAGMKGARVTDTGFKMQPPEAADIWFEIGGAEYLVRVTATAEV
jgi:hypothetical protein